MNEHWTGLDSGQVQTTTEIPFTGSRPTL